MGRTPVTRRGRNSTLEISVTFSFSADANTLLRHNITSIYRMGFAEMHTTLVT